PTNPQTHPPPQPNKTPRSHDPQHEFTTIFRVPSEKIITIKFKLNGEVTKETKSARAVIQEAVDRMKFICDKLSADKGECKEVTFRGEGSGGG
ncbi:hypothetical protein NQU33_24940, partial [Escherichia coli]|nr:hypothetical protein [Escherichia coli]